MSYFLNNQQRLNDVIFSGRNKEYGAYAIRSSYGNTVFKSLSIVVFSFGSLMSLAFYFSNRNTPPDEKTVFPFENDSLISVIYEMKKDEPKAGTPALPETPSTTEPPENTAVTIVDSTAVVETRTLINEPATDPNLIASTGNTTGSTGSTGSPGGSPGGGGGGGEGTAPPEPTDLYMVDKEPEFEGGLKALINFVSRNVRYPSLAADRGEQGTVYVRFVVDEKGKVSHVTLLNNLGYGLDDEAKRVVSLIPDFKSPAMVHGKPVKVYYQLPIRFRLR